jgi:hypothetical protein
MREVTINTNQILLDRTMNKYLTEKCNFNNSSLKSFGFKPLPASRDKVVGQIKPDKIEDLKKAYLSNEQNKIPLPYVKKISQSYYSIEDGRHRVTIAICNGVPKMTVKVVNEQPLEKHIRSKSRSKSQTKSRSRSQTRKSSDERKKRQSRSRSRSRPRSRSKSRSRSRSV